MPLTREEILSYSDLPMREVKIPQWGNGSVYVKTLNGFEYIALTKEMAVTYKDDAASLNPCLLAGTICDETGKLLFSYDDVEALGKTHGAAFIKLFAVANELNPMFGKDLDETAKN